MLRWKELALSVLLLIIGEVVLGQDAVLYSQLFNQPELFNPAVNGTAEGARVGLYYRDQWRNVEGAPKTMALDAFYPLPNKKLGIGLSAFNQSIGLREINFLMLNLNSHIDVNATSTLSFGIRFGMEFSSYDREKIISVDNNSLNYEDLNAVSPAFNLGLVYKGPNYYLGLSTFQISFKDELAQGKLLTGIDFMAGYFYQSSTKFIVYPYLTYKTYLSHYSAVEPGVNVYFADKIGAGIGFRTGESLVFNFKVKITEKVVMGYSYDYSTGDFSKISNGSHEIHLGYVIGKRNILLPF